MHIFAAEVYFLDVRDRFGLDGHLTQADVGLMDDAASSLTHLGNEVVSLVQMLDRDPSGVVGCNLNRLDLSLKASQLELKAVFDSLPH